MQRKFKIPFHNSKTEVPIVKFYLDNGYEGFAVIDSGSESTVFDKDIIKQNKKSFTLDVTQDKMNLVGVANDQSAVPVVYAKANISFGAVSIEVNGMVVPLTHITQHCKELGEDIVISAIIGSDTLTKYGVKLNYNKKEMVI